MGSGDATILTSMSDRGNSSSPATIARPRLHDLVSRVPNCMLREQAIFRAKLSKAEQLLRAGRPADRLLWQIAADIAASEGRLTSRRANAPCPTFPQNLPVVERREEIAKAIAGNQVVVLCGETGSGKTTQLPKICLSLNRGVSGMNGHTQPRRIAARSVAARLAQEPN